MLSLLKIIIFFAVIWFFGWEFCLLFLKEKRKIFLGALSLAFAISLYIFLINIISYIITPPLSFFLVFVFFLIGGVILFLINYKKYQILNDYFSSKQIKTIIIIAFTISIINGFISLRTLEFDDYAPFHIPAASLFAQGNFPPKNPISPNANLVYHYAPDLFSAALTSLTDIPFWLSYDIQTALFSGLVFLLAFLLIYQLAKNYYIALITAAGFLYASGLNYFLIFPFAVTLYQKFILGMAIEHPFNLLDNIAEGDLTKSLISQFHLHTPSLAFIVVLLVIYLFLMFYRGQISHLSFGLIGGILFGFLALSQETTFVILFFAFLIPFLFILIKEKKFSLGLFIFLIIGAVLSLTQGGVLSDLKVFWPIFSFTSKAVQGGVTQTVVKTANLEINFWSFLREFGLPLFLFFPAVVFLRKRIPGQLLWILVFTIIISLVVPFFIRYLYPRELIRFFWLASSFLALISSFYLAWLLFETQQSIWTKRIIGSIFILMVFNSFIFQLMYTVFPLGAISRAPQQLFAFYPKKSITQLEKRVREWIHQNTTINDWFFAVDLSKEPYTSINHRFVVLFGRFAPAYHYRIDLPLNSAEADIYKKLITSCQADDLKKLNYKYIYIDKLWPTNLEEICLKNNRLTLIYNDSDKENIIHIYKIEP